MTGTYSAADTFSIRDRIADALNALDGYTGTEYSTQDAEALLTSGFIDVDGVARDTNMAPRPGTLTAADLEALPQFSAVSAAGSGWWKRDTDETPWVSEVGNYETSEGLAARGATLVR